MGRFGWFGGPGVVAKGKVEPMLKKLCLEDQKGTLIACGKMFFFSGW